HRHVAELVRKRAVWRNDERAADDTPVLPPEHALLLPNAVKLGHLVLGVGQQREGQSVPSPELLVRLHAVGAHSEYHGLQPLELGKGIAKVASLRSASGRVVLRVEIQHYRATSQVAEGQLLPFVCGQREVGRDNRLRGHPSGSPPMSTAMMAFCTCSLFSASSHTRLCGPSIT